MSDWYTCGTCGEYVDSTPDFHTVRCPIRQEADRAADRLLAQRTRRTLEALVRRQRG